MPWSKRGEPVSYQLRDISKHDNESKRNSLKTHQPIDLGHSKAAVTNAFELHPSVKKVLEIERDETARIERKVNERLDALREKAIEEAKQVGYREGFEAGRKEGFERFQEETRESVDRIEALSTEYENQKADLFRANERFLLEMVAQLAKKVVLRELQTDAEYLSRVSKAIIEKLGIKENVRIWLNGEDVACLQSLRESLIQKFGELRNLQIGEHPEVSRGGCIVETDFGIVDATIEAQIKSIDEALIGKTE